MKKPSNFITVKTLFVLFVLVICSGTILSQNKVDEIDKAMIQFYQVGKFIGSVLIADSSGIIYKNGFGYANIELSIPNQPLTKHRIASMTKAFTSVLLMQLVEEGKMKLNATVTD